MKKITYLFKKNDINILVIVKESQSPLFELFLYRIQDIIHNIYIISQDYDTFKKIFNSPECCETFHLYNESGRLVLKGLNWSIFNDDILAKIRKFSSNDKFFITDFINPEKNIRNIDGFEEVFKITNKNKYEFIVFSLFSDICNSCLSGKIIKELKKLHSSNFSSILFIMVLSSKYSKRDISNLIKIEGINFPVIIAKGSLSRNWNRYIEKYGESSLNNILFITNEDGNILKITKNNFKEFFDYVKSLNTYSINH